MFAGIEEIDKKEEDEFKIQFEDFAAPFSQLLEEENEIRRRNAPDFNIFSFLNFERDELFHSNFLSYLFDPRKSHEQGFLFLRTFFDTIKNSKDKPQVPDFDLTKGIWFIHREYSFNQGRFDIVLRNNDLSALYVIENKVDAPDQHRQLERYGDYLRLSKNKYFNQGLFFLTKEGDSSFTSNNSTYYRISYHSDIKNWLITALPQIEAETVRGTVRQYINLIEWI